MPNAHDRSRRPAALIAAVAALSSLAACSKPASNDTGASTTTTTASTETTAPANTSAPAASAAPEATPAAAPAAGAAAKPAPDNVDTVAGVKFAAYKGDAASGKTVFVQCMTCHTIDAGVNRIGPSLHGVVGRHAGIEPGFTYSAANKDSGITWSEEKLFQYLEAPQRVVPGTKMTFTGVKDPQKRADVIAYLKSNS